MKRVGLWFTVIAAVLCVQAMAAAPELVANGGFEKAFEGWTRWGTNSDLITLDTAVAHSGSNSAKIASGHNALYFMAPVIYGKAYEIRFFYRAEGGSARGQFASGFSDKEGAHRSAGFETCDLGMSKAGKWVEFKHVFIPASSAVSGQYAFTADQGSTLWVDDVSLKVVPRPMGLEQMPDPWEGLKHRTGNPLFKELLTDKPGGYTMLTWSHHLNRQLLPKKAAEDYRDDAKWVARIYEVFDESGKAGLGFMDLPGRLDGKEPWRTPGFHEEMFRKYGVRYDVWSEGSGSTAPALKNGAELLNAKGRGLGRKPSVSLVDPKYVEAQADILRKLGAELKGKPFVGYYYGKDEPSIRIPDGSPDSWGDYGKAMWKEVREKYGFGKFRAPLPRDKAFESDPNKPYRWIAYNRWMSDKFVDSRSVLRKALLEGDPQARYSPVDYWFMSGFVPYDHSRMAACSDLMELDPYGSSAEVRRGRGVYNHGFGAKYMSDLTEKPVRIIAQAFDYAGYDMAPEDLREWVSQSFRCGASAIDYYTLDNPCWTDPDRWKMMLHLSSEVTRMNRVDLPKDPDCAVLYTLYTHMSHGPQTTGDQVYSAHALVGELAGSWYRFISDTQMERGERDLKGYKVVYLPLAKYMTPETTRKIEEYVKAGGVLVCGDAEAFGSDLAGNDTSSARERILGVKTLGPKNANGIVVKNGKALLGLPDGSVLKLFKINLGDESSLGRAREIRLVDKSATVLGAYADGKPAIVSHKLGKGRVITFAANPFAPQVTVDKSLWPAAFKSMQKSLGCKVDRPIWRFLIPPMPKGN